jgi:hypothetical protein
MTLTAFPMLYIKTKAHIGMEFVQVARALSSQEPGSSAWLRGKRKRAACEFNLRPSGARARASFESQ